MISRFFEHVHDSLSRRASRAVDIWRHVRKQRRVVISLFVLLAAELIAISQPLLLQPSYALGDAKDLLAPSTPSLTERLKYDSQTKTFLFNDGFVAAPTGVAQSPTPGITAVTHEDASKGMTVTDPTLKTSFSVKPRFGLHDGKRNDNRVIYPLIGKKGWLVYSMHSASVKEDVILTESPGDRYDLEYDLMLENGTEARLETDGSIGVYGNSLLTKNVTTGSDADAKLLQKARNNAEKRDLLFSIPAPVVIERGKQASAVKSTFQLNGSKLKVVTEGLDDASYPLSIDPSIYVETAAKFMRGNNETNVDFDVQDTLIQKGKTTGARFDQLTSTTALPSSRWGNGTAVAGGYIYSVGGNNGSSNQSTLHWAKFSASNSSISSPNPGNGSCGSWCTDNSYSLPAARTGLSLVAYNGFLYAIGGEDSSCTTVNGTGDSGICNTVYVAKLGANGEPRLWHPTDNDQGNWVYWHRSGDLSSTRSYTAAVAYQNRLYLLGGKSHLDLGGVTTVEAADMRPNGSLGSWSTSGMSPLPVGAGRQHHSVEVYNDRLYVIGGVDGTVDTSNIVSTVFYTRLVNGATNGWSQTNSLSAPRMTWGGSFTAVWGGHIYQTGGCSAVNASGYCTTIEQSTQFTSINMAGNLTQWRDMNGVTNQFIGHSIETWNGAIYRVGGCSLQDGVTGACTTPNTSTGYALINAPGDITAVNSSAVSGSGTCSGANPYDCHLPPVGDSAAQGGQLLAATVAIKGYLYVIGGCTNAGCTGASGNVSYARISATGTLTKPATCTGGSYYGSWCVDATNRVNGTTGVAAAGIASYGDSIYIVGGTNGTSNTDALYRNTVNDDGSLSGAWTSQTLSGLGATSVAHAFAYARANPNSAATNPANLYIFGGCSTTSAAACTSNNYSTTVYKCNIQTSSAVAGCTTTGQLQIDSESAGGSQGLGMHSGTVFANYIYLAGGASQSSTSKNSVLYAKFDDSNNVVAQSGGQWVQAASTLSSGRAANVSFGYNGYLYVMGGYNTGTSTVLGSVETAKINAIDGSIGSFAVSSTGVGARWGATVGVSSSTAYILGGCSAGAGTCTTLDPSFRSIQIHNNESGAPESYAPAANLFNTDRLAASAAVLNGYIYVAGGCTDSATCNTTTNNVQYAQLDSYGNVGTWANTTAPLPAGRAWGQLEVAGGSLYFIGGQDDAEVPSADIYYAAPSSGNVTTWSTTTSSLPSARSQHSAAVWDNRIYVTGGSDSTGAVQNTVYVSPQLNTGGDVSTGWTSLGSFDVARSGLTAIAYANNLYILGGYTGTTHLSDVQYAKINADGTLGSWTFGTSLPTPIQQADGFAANGYMYLFGGRSGTTEADCQDRTYVAPISANTAISSGNDPTGLGSWYEASAQYGGVRYGIATAYHDGKAYLLGGGCAEILNQSEVYSTPGAHTFTSPEETTSVSVEVWGGGGGGGNGENGGTNNAGAGAGGGGYARHTMPVTPGNYPLSVGAGGAGGLTGGAGGGSWFNTSSTVFGAGGAGAGNGLTIGLGGTANIGSDATFNGGNGGTGHNAATPTNRRGGGGGGSAFFNANGSNGTNGTASAGSGIGGNGTGIGGNGGSNTGAGTAGAVPGAGGGGGGYRGAGGAGAAGRVIVYYQEWSELILTGNNRVTVATLASQPQVASYSYLIDTDEDVFPSAWLINGVDNNIGARWNLKYRSMNAADGVPDNCGTADMTSWGQETTYGEVTLGQPEAYVARDGSGNDINCSRYFYLLLTIDSSRTYGYPDDVTRGPTITDLTLQFTANPSQRLMHGRTFTGGLQQPIDTPFFTD